MSTFFSRFSLFSCFLPFLDRYGDGPLGCILFSTHNLELYKTIVLGSCENASLVFLVRFSDDNQIESSRKILMPWEKNDFIIW